MTPRERRAPPAVWLLAVGQTTGYASLYYIYPALLPALAAGTGWSKATLAAGPTAAMLIAALGAPFAGRLVDAGHGGRLLTFGALAGGAALAALAFATDPALCVLCWVVIGFAQAASFYEVCFSVLTLGFPDAARAAITRVTLVAGFASSLAFPAGAAMAALWGWQGAVLGFAALQLGLTVPVNLAGLRLLRARAPAGGAGAPPGSPAARAARAAAFRATLRRREFWLIGALFGLVALNHGLLVTYCLPLFADRGAGAGLAVLAAALIGPAQVAGRVALMLNEGRVSAGAALRLCAAMLCLAAAALWLAGAAVWLILAFAALQGAAMGMVSILKPVVTAERLGRAAFGAVSGTLYMAPLLATALSPQAGAVLLTRGGAAALIAVAAGLAVTALAVAAVLHRGGAGDQ